jgi:membrane fusion protein (multidrug efflux system)
LNSHEQDGGARGVTDRNEDRERQGRSEDATGRAGRTRRIVIGAVVGCLVLLAAGGYGLYWYVTARYLISTDDAYTQADNIAVSPQVAGYISKLAVTDNQQVRAGDVIVTIDDRTYRADVDQTRADLAEAVANEANAEAQIDLQQAVIAQAQSDVKAADAAATFAQEELDRYAALARSGAGTVQRRQQAASDLRQQQADLAKAQAALATELKRLGVLDTAKRQAEATILRNRALLERSEIDLGYTIVRAPIDGVVGDRSVRLGQYVEAGTRLLTIVPMTSIYVVANYKETQLDRMHQGQPVEIDIDAYPDVTVHGRVDSLAPGSGSQFALLPPENATGNFTKIVQRVPVKILIDASDPLKGRLRPGLSVTPTVDTRDTRGKKLEERPSQLGLPAPPSPAAAGAANEAARKP